MSTISIVGQIGEAKRLIGDQEQRYNQLVNSGKMRREEGEMLMQRLYAILETLYFCQEHRAGFVEYMAAKKAGSA